MSNLDTAQDRYKQGVRLISPLIDHLEEKGFKDTDLFNLFANFAIAFIYNRERDNWKKTFIDLIENVTLDKKN